MNTKVTLIDSGQDFQIFICDDTGKIIEVYPEPEIKSIWIGSYLPINDENLMQEGLYCPIRKAYSSSYGYLRHKIEKIEKL
ncbi:MAG: hypothetical protein PHR52_05160 [Fermentimonas sp.]|nr:hypothetical protein [Fermentimonas sp.]MDD4696904.1 hypothetical protein [Fermentimonas sp.]